LDLLGGQLRVAEGDVVGDGAAEQDDGLRDEPEQRPARGVVQRAWIVAGEPQLPVQGLCSPASSDKMLDLLASC